MTTQNDIDIFDRTRRLIGQSGLDKLQKSKVLVFGLGGVGSYVLEGLARAGVGFLGIVDKDVVAYSNINRQLIALFSTVGKKKTDVSYDRLKDINPNIEIMPYDICYDQSTAELIDFSKFDFIVDAIDSVKSKLEIIKRAQITKTPVISCMGTGFRLDPSRLKITDISLTKGCPLAKTMRKLLKNEGIKDVKVLFSDEPPINSFLANKNTQNGEHILLEKYNNIIVDTQNEKNQTDNLNKQERKDSQNEQSLANLAKTIASISFVPSVAGLLISCEVIKSLLNLN